MITPFVEVAEYRVKPYRYPGETTQGDLIWNADYRVSGTIEDFGVSRFIVALLPQMVAPIDLDEDFEALDEKVRNILPYNPLAPQAALGDKPPGLEALEAALEVGLSGCLALSQPSREKPFRSRPAARNFIDRGDHWCALINQDWRSCKEPNYG